MKPPKVFLLPSYYRRILDVSVYRRLDGTIRFLRFHLTFIVCRVIKFKFFPDKWVLVEK